MPFAADKEAGAYNDLGQICRAFAIIGGLDPHNRAAVLVEDLNDALLKRQEIALTGVKGANSAQKKTAQAKIRETGMS